MGIPLIDKMINYILSFELKQLDLVVLSFNKKPVLKINK